MPSEKVEDASSTNAMNDRELCVEVQRLSDVLSSCRKDATGADDWEERLVALQRLCQLARADISKRHGFLSLMGTYVKVPLLRHIEEMRTVLSNEACAVVAAFAKHSSSRPAWRVASEWFVPALLQLTIRTKRTSITAAMEALETLARTKSFGASSFAELLRGCTARHAAMRRSAFGVLQLIVQEGQNEDDEFPLSKYLDAVGRVLREGLVDADAEVRVRARRCYWTFHAAEPEAAGVLYKGLENPVKRALDRERRGNVLKKQVAMVDGPPPTPAVKARSRADTGITKEDSPHLLAAPVAGKSHQEDKFIKGEISQNTPSDAAESWVLVQDALRSTLWSQRLLGLQRLSTEFPQLPKKTECVKLLLPRLNDPNCRVSQAAIQAVGMVMRSAPALLKNEMPELVASLLINVSGNKEALSSASRELLAAIIRTNSVDDVAHAVYRVLGDIVAPKVKLQAVEYAQYLYTENADHFSQLSPLKLSMTRMLFVLQSDRRNSDLHKAAVAAFTVLYAVAKNTFLRVLFQFTSEERETIVDALEAAVPHLAQECRRRSSGERQLQHPPPHVRSPFAEALGRRGDASSESAKRPNASPTVRPSRSTPAGASAKKAATHKKMRSASPVDGRLEGAKQKSLAATGAVGVRGASATRNSPNSKRPSQHTRASLHYDPTSTSAVPLSRRVTYEDVDVVDLLDRLDEACGVVDTCAVLDRINSMIATNPKLWLDVFGRLLMQLEKLIPQSIEPDHTVRCRGVKVLVTTVGNRILQRPVSRSLKRVILLARTGIDDAFPEVQLEATSLLQVILSSGIYTIDHCLNALAMSLDIWLLGNRDESTRGWITLLESVEHLLDQHGRNVVLLQSNCANNDINGHPPAQNGPPEALSEPVLRRVSGVVVRAVQHSVSEVRLTAVLTCVSIWMALDTVALPYLVDLTASQRKLVSIYYNMASSARMPEWRGATVQRDMSREMRAMGLQEAGCL
ncbi:putative CLIP-associating protein 1-like [Trypanosoma grayi]|uniref:putative CLIP-associating protein 1-like n=1 Tax=Trypanosoma grayi TaxID=71804 RepID=UPI0004F47395|nr:putative CLIP-associating protein 1-like [Trypanosoma grayi]KEG13465.1 putative CLIP-associating protein 1-like [Trypanosoma grayi]